MRVIAGSCRGRPLRAPAGGATRPTGDRVREAVFDILGSLVDLEGAAVADLFAGSGALGIEALSRGAASCTFVDDAPAALAVVRENLAALGLAGRSVVVRRDVLAFLEGEHRFDLSLCDPPYEFTAWEVLLGRLSAPLAVLESRRPVTAPAGWEVIRHKRYGGTLVTVVRSPGAPQEAP
ncbi:MAG TPA: 16S rRNA (guanine(966)-N(2))-methyltransferase RsmD [Acidimicrobiales bacterium]|nr:16S rRNA (guanine(966)-N(2))-methyltransferase RsmD [Acidimicrobiales bacterium]